MRRHLLVPAFASMAALALGACAADFAPANDLSVRDFSGTVDDFASMTSDGNGLTDGGPDLARSSDLGVGDLALPPDLTVPPDLTPLTCDMAMGDAGTSSELILAGVGAGNQLVAASFSSISGWAIVPTTAGGTVSDAVVVSNGAGRPVIVARQVDTTLSWTTLEPCTGRFAALAQIYAAATTSLRPAITGGSAVDVVFRGSVNNDQRYYHSALSGATWTAPSTQSSFLSNHEPTAVRQSGSLHTIFTGTDSNLYDGVVSDAAGGGAATAIAGASSNLAPAVAVRPDGTIDVVFVANGANNTKIYWTSKPVGGSFSTPQYLCGAAAGCFILTDQRPAMAIDASGMPVVGWHGMDGHAYTSSLSSTTWSAPIEATAQEQTNFAPALASGIGTAAAELVYVRADGAARHTRLTGGSWQSPITISGVTLLNSPGLVTLP